MRLGHNHWGKSEVRVSKVHRGESDDFSDVTVQVLLEGDVEAAFLEGDNGAVLPTDTMRNTVYGLAQEYLTKDLEDFADTLTAHFHRAASASVVALEIRERQWTRTGANGFVGGSSQHRTVSTHSDDDGVDRRSGLSGLVVLKTGNSAFLGFPQDSYTILPEAEDRLLATSVDASWRYSTFPTDTTGAWNRAREAMTASFLGEWSASVQHQGWLMAKAVFEAVGEIDEIRFDLPNQHHLRFGLDRFGLEEQGVVFHPVSEPYGDISVTVHRE